MTTTLIGNATEDTEVTEKQRHKDHKARKKWEGHKATIGSDLLGFLLSYSSFFSVLSVHSVAT
jgi:hypothetical protein